jgi:hypothetical protein
MLEQEPQVGAERRPQRKDQAQDHRSALCVAVKKGQAQDELF